MVNTLIHSKIEKNYAHNPDGDKDKKDTEPQAELVRRARVAHLPEPRVDVQQLSHDRDYQRILAIRRRWLRRVATTHL